MSLDNTIHFEHVSRWYGQIIGLNDVSFTIPKGLTALLGPNGAGKSTMLKLVTGQIKPTTGGIAVLGEQPFANPRVARSLGYCPEIDNFYEDMTGRQFVELMATLSGYKGEDKTKRVQSSIDRVGMSDRCDRKLGGYSKGMRQRIKVAQAIVHDPKVLVLDEPLNGLDPLGRRDMVNLYQQFAEEGMCVLISSHILYEVEQITDRILVMYKGRLLAQGGIRDIRKQIDSHPHRISLTTDNPRKLAGALLLDDTVISARMPQDNHRVVEVETAQPEKFYSNLADIILDGGFDVEVFKAPDNNLEAVFRYLVSA